MASDDFFNRIEFVISRVVEDGGWDENVSIADVDVGLGVWKEIMDYLNTHSWAGEGFGHTTLQYNGAHGIFNVRPNKEIFEDDIRFATRTLRDIIVEDILLGNE